MSLDRKARLSEVDHWDELLAIRDRQREQTKDALQIVRFDDLPQETSRQGLMRWYMHPSIKDTVLSTLLFFEQEILPGSRSGRIKFQGGQVLLILEGEGYTILDGVRHTWKAGDVVNLPLRPYGVTVQHFNSSKTTSVKFVAAEPNFIDCVTVDRGSGFEQIEDAPEYKGK